MSRDLKRVMYLEDDEHIAEIAQLSLVDFSDLEVQHFARGAAAIEAFETYKPDLLLFDVMLPDMDGVETLAEIRKLESGADVPVIFMTAKAQTHEQQHYLDMGALAVIVKPFDAFELGDQVKRIWAESRTGSKTETVI